MKASSNSDHPPILNIILAGGIGGGTADFTMHGIDTVKTRLQGQPYPPKYTNLTHTFKTMLKEEGVFRGLYGGVVPAMIGSVCCTSIYFGTYETLKKKFQKTQLPESVQHLTSGALAELVISVIYVPTEVVKTRMQLQGRYNNPHFVSGYNYKSTTEAFTTIIQNDGIRALFRGYRATLLRDVPCTALQFTLYEFFKSTYLSKYSKDNVTMGFIPEMAIGALAGSIAGGITTPLDVVKTILQTQYHPPKRSRSSASTPPQKPTTLTESLTSITNTPQTKTISKLPSSKSTIIGALQNSYKKFGVSGLFSGLAPRLVWTGCQSAIMFLVYEETLLLINQ